MFLKSSMKKIKLLGLFVVILAIPLTITLLRQQTQTQQQAATVKGVSQSLGQYGISGSVLTSLNATDLNTYLDDYKALGVQWIRFDFPWAWIQPTNTATYTWAPYDAVVNAANARGIKVLGVIFEPPQWAINPTCTRAEYYQCPPRSNAEYATFAAKVVTHYAPMGVHTWEIWNEQNSNTFWANPSVASYTSLLKAAYPAIKQADPNAFVLTGGTSPAASDGTDISPVDFLVGIYANGGKGYFDAVAHHPYCYGGTSTTFNCPKTFASWSAWSQMQDTNPSLRSVMIANGDEGKQIWATEFGAPTAGNFTYAAPVTEAQQAQMVTDAYTLFNSYSWSGPLFWYTYNDLCATTDIECYFGLVHTDYSHKPAYDAFKKIATSVLTPTPLVGSTQVSSLSESGTSSRQPVKASFTLNTLGTLHVDTLIVAMRDRNNTNVDIAIKTNYNLIGTQSFSNSRTLSVGSYTYWVAYSINGNWTDLSPKKSFTLTK